MKMKRMLARGMIRLWFVLAGVFFLGATWWFLVCHPAGTLPAGQKSGGTVSLFGRVIRVNADQYVLQDPTGRIRVSSESPPRTAKRWVWVKGRIHFNSELEPVVVETRRLGTF